MADIKISGLPASAGVGLGDLIHSVDVSNTTNNPTGESTKVTVDELATYLSTVLTNDVNVTNFTYDQITKVITLTESDNTTHSINVSDLVDTLPTGTVDGQILVWDNTAGEFIIGSPSAVPNASTTMQGVVELATNTEALAGVDTTRAVTPSGASAAISAALATAVVSATETAEGIAELATQAEVDAGTDTERIVTPATLATYVTANAGGGGGGTVQGTDGNTYNVRSLNEGYTSGTAKGENSVDLQTHSLASQAATAGATGIRSVVGGGSSNQASGEASTVSGGASCKATGAQSFIGGGTRNETSGLLSIIVGGGQGMATANYSSILGGRQNTASGLYSSITGGQQNTASGDYSSIINGANQTASGEYCTVIGSSNTGSTDNSLVVGKSTETSSDDILTVGYGTGGVLTSNAKFQVKRDGAIYANSLSVFANDSAASAGGLTQGAIYQTATGELRIKI